MSAAFLPKPLSSIGASIPLDFASALLAHAVPAAASGGVFASSLAVTIIGLTDLC